MTSDEFAEALRCIGWSLRHVAELLECDAKLPIRWSHGDATIPPSIARWLTNLVACHEKLPPPEDWRVR